MDEAYQEANFPVAGIDLSRAFADQRPAQMPNGVWGRTTRAGVNVRGFDAEAERKRGGSRPGLSKYIPVAVVAGVIVQDLNVVVITATPAVV